MKVQKRFILILGLWLYAVYGFTQNMPPEITVSGGQIYCPQTQMPIVTSVSISDPDPGDTTLPEIYVQISEGYQYGFDTLELIGVNPNITSSWNASEGLLTLSGPATFDEFSNAVENIVFQTTQTSFTQDKQFSINLGDANYLPSTGHYYFYVSSPGITWTEAKDAAAAQTFYGLQGYLATLTSEEESQLAGEQSAGTGWIGGSDRQNEGIWIWETGPEAGQVFWQGTSNGYAPNNMYTFWNDYEPNNFNEEHYAHITDPSVGVLGSWNDLGNTGALNPDDPYHPQGYIVEYGGMPNEPEIRLSASSTLIMPRVSSNDITVCGTGTFILYADASTPEVRWFNTSTSTTPIHEESIYEVQINTTTTYWLQPVVLGCTTNIERYPITVTINDIPSVNDITIWQCEDDIMDGLSNFNLGAFNDVIVNGDLTDIEVQFYESMDFSIPIDEDNYTNTVNNQVVYAQVLDVSTNCSAVAELTLSVNTNISNYAYLTACDDLEETGLASFDLLEAEDQILNALSPDVNVLGYFETYSDALLQENQLNTNFTNSEAYNQIIYARLEQNGSCYSITEVELNVEPIPNLREDETLYYCLNSFPDTITLEGGIVDDTPNNFYYHWSTGETTMTIEVNAPGVYTVEVTKPLGCTNIRTITVLPSETAAFETVEIVDISENNSVSVLVSGQGDYVFALDDENGAYQSSNTFENVSAGLHSVYVKDLKGDCGIVSQTISVLGFPKFFTPNGDTVNDTWQIKGFSSDIADTVYIEIFNRYGKLVAVVNSTNHKWDGTSNGKVLPTDDYWFVAEFIDGRTVTGHFTLKR
ncbi:T9SS type B sorting domain-containing protein [Winogradskyella sediminis]|uniref:Gliding motility-associated C-terminal domain-containing protein n=1 Tax=Winogradskyella sediminis TaxID=1382466 RepID=A0A1H1UVY4_9FLAO|nr:T9SS type B sorting domain-containing protein [Winogradskyella sediminis]SDS76266.1 gliding motility-associated C-terminal domain-containing protein [Winogradskyella sediminis]